MFAKLSKPSGVGGGDTWYRKYQKIRNWFVQLSKPRVLVITGPTCVGKTNLSIDLAKQLNGEVISADSVQVYRGLDIGSSKIRNEEMDGIRHHLIDICDPHEDYSAGRFAREARNATSDILSRGKTPIVVGGTGFYLKWYIHGVANTKKSTKESRQRAEDYLNKLWQEARDRKGEDLNEEEKWNVGIEALKQAGDPAAAERISAEKNNYYRLTRALEILLENEEELASMAIDTTQPLDFDFRCYFLHRSRLEIYQRIEQRCEDMLREGVLKEAQSLLDAGLLPNTNSATRSIGYRQCMEFLLEVKRGDVELTDEVVKDFIFRFDAATRKLVKQQLTWFRGEDLYKWIDLSSQTHHPKDIILQDWQKLRLPSFHRELGLLKREEEQALKRYQPCLHYYKEATQRAEIIHEIQSLVWDEKAKNLSHEFQATSVSMD